jgi:hypothetical protein
VVVVYFDDKKAVVSSLHNAIDKVKTTFSKLTPIYAYVELDLPPVYYNFFDKSKFSSHFAYIQRDDMKFIKGIQECQINSKNFDRIVNTLSSMEVKSESTDIFLYDNGITQKDQTDDRKNALLELFEYFSDEIKSGEYCLQYFYHAFHLPPSIFHLFNMDGSPTESFALLKRSKNSFESLPKETLALAPFLVKYSINKEVL